MPSCELPAIRMTASWILETLGGPPPAGVLTAESLMVKTWRLSVLINAAFRWAETNIGKPPKDLPNVRLTSDRGVSNDYPNGIRLDDSDLHRVTEMHLNAVPTKSPKNKNAL